VYIVNLLCIDLFQISSQTKHQAYTTSDILQSSSPRIHQDTTFTIIKFDQKQAVLKPKT